MSEVEARGDTETFEDLVHECLRRRPGLDASDLAWRLRALLAVRRLEEAREAEVEALLIEAPIRAVQEDIDERGEP